MMRITAILVLSAAACGGSQKGLQAKAQQPEPQPGPGVTCQWEQPTGSFIRRRVCRYDDELEQAKRTAHDLWTRPRMRQSSRD